MSKKRPIKHTTLKRIVIAILAIGMVIIGLAFTRTIIDKRALISQGQQVAGIVQEQSSRQSGPRTSSPAPYKITYSFTPKDSQQKLTQKNFPVSKNEYEQYRVGSQIPISYLPSNPSLNQPTASLKHVSPISLNFMYLFLAVIIAIFATKLMKKLQSKYSIAPPHWLYYLTYFGGFMVAFAIAAALTALISSALGGMLAS